MAEGTLPHRGALGFPGLAGGFTFTIYGWSRGAVIQASVTSVALLHRCAEKRGVFIPSGSLRD